MLLKSLGLIASGLISSVLAADLPSIDIVGNKFFFSNNGSQFYMKGIAYQSDTSNVTSDETFVDPLADEDACTRDVPYLAAVATNVIRVYALNASLDHSHCMQLLNDNGIYVIADLSEPALSINRDDPSWTVELFDRYTTIIDEFQQYSNVLGFFAGNEVSNNETNTDASAFVKAAVRDSKQYIKDQGYRSIPVGYSANDDAIIRVAIADYFTCGDDDVRADFYGINMYSWCGDSSFTKSGYDDRTEEFSNITVPLFFSEYGCNEVQPRKFTEVAALYGPQMTDVWSGGIVYMYFQETNDYGLVSVDGDSVKTLDDYNYYKTQILKVSPTSATASNVASASQGQVLSCPTQDKVWRASTDLPPTPDDGLCVCLEESLKCVVADDVDPENYAEIFGYVCGSGTVSCDGIQANGTSGEYGAFSFCSSKQRLSFVLNLYYNSQKQAASACDFDGQAVINKDASSNDVCKAALSAVGDEGTNIFSGTISGASTATRASSGATSTGTRSGSSSSATASSAAPSSSANAAGVMNVNYLFGSIASIIVAGLALI